MVFTTPSSSIAIRSAFRLHHKMSILLGLKDYILQNFQPFTKQRNDYHSTSTHTHQSIKFQLQIYTGHRSNSRQAKTSVLLVVSILLYPDFLVYSTDGQPEDTDLPVYLFDRNTNNMIGEGHPKMRHQNQNSTVEHFTTQMEPKQCNLVLHSVLSVHHG